MNQQVEHLDIKRYMHEIASEAKKASRQLAKASSGLKNEALSQIAVAIEASQDKILSANQLDLQAGRQNDLADALLDRLELTPARIEAMVSGLRQIVGLADPVGQVSDLNYQPSGIKVGKMRTPLGVIGIIYESRPNVTIDAAALCLKSGNAALLRGGSEAFHSNQVLAQCIAEGLEQAGLPKTAVQVIATVDRDAVGELLKLSQFVDIIIPRGGRRLIERVRAESRIPVIKHLDGNCHVYIDAAADHAKAMAIAFNAKARRYGICGAMETLLVADSIAQTVLPELIKQYQAKGIELRGCERARVYGSDIAVASEEDWYTEYLGPVLAIKVVDDIDQAIEHIERYGSHHTDAIVTEDMSQANRFLVEVDSSSVMVNSSTQFADGFEYGLGAEIGISTDKLHVRGPVGLEGLTTQKYVVFGDGHIRV